PTAGPNARHRVPRPVSAGNFYANCPNPQPIRIAAGFVSLSRTRTLSTPSGCGFGGGRGLEDRTPATHNTPEERSSEHAHPFFAQLNTVILHNSLTFRKSRNGFVPATAPPRAADVPAPRGESTRAKTAPEAAELTPRPPFARENETHR